MSTLITYPASSIPADLRQPLANACNPLYLPMRRLKPRRLDRETRRRVEHADIIMVTSEFALDIFLCDFAPAWLGRHPHGKLLVLSEAMAQRAAAHGVTNTLVSAEENRDGLVEAWRTLVNLDAEHNATAVLLQGNLHLASHTPLPDAVFPVSIYENVWNDEDETDASQRIAAYTAINGRVSRILVTSPSSYRRLRAICTANDTSFIHNPVFYALGPSTATAIRETGGIAVEPGVRKDVLRRIILCMLHDAHDNQPKQESEPEIPLSGH